MQETRLAWIFGSSRSGSTWLLKMLSDLEGVVPVDDPHLGHHLGVWRPIPLAWAACEDPPELSTLLDLKAGESGYFFAERHRDAWWEPLRALIAARFEAQAADAGLRDPADASAFVVKEPGSHVAPLLADLFPASKVVFLLRDGRDVVDSWLDAYSEGSWAIPGGAFPVSAEGRLPLIRWLSAVWAYRSRAVRQAYESRGEGERILIRYEDLRGGTEEWLEKVCALIGIDAERVPEVVEGHRFERQPRAARGRRRFIRRARPGSWRETLSAAEQRAMHEEMGDALAEFGYDVDEPLAATG
ncbi:MAG TPA: sulfotransferase [Solirubrobacterales bacterium]|nr:sulfotransferase [Solirubrobacterales bacterium]